MKADIKKLSALDEMIAWEQATATLDELRNRLHQGASKSGTTLTADECYLLARHIATPPRPLGKPTGDPLRSFTIALFCLRCEREGMEPKVAIAATMKHFDISRSTVYAARIELHSPSK